MSGNTGIASKRRQDPERTAKFSYFSSVLIAVVVVCAIVYASNSVINAIVFSALFLTVCYTLLVFGAAIGLYLALNENAGLCAGCGVLTKNGSLCEKCEEEQEVGN